MKKFFYLAIASTSIACAEVPFAPFSENLIALEDHYEIADKIESKEGYKVNVAPRLGFFYFIDKTARDIYNHGAVDIELDANYWFLPRYSLWGNSNFIWSNGATTALESQTTLDMLTLSFGAKEYFTSRNPNLKMYLGIGFTTAFLWIFDNSQFVDNKEVRLSGGAVGKLGFIYNMTKLLMADLFFDYYYQPVSTDTNSTLTDPLMNVGGFRTGLGISAKF